MLCSKICPRKTREAHGGNDRTHQERLLARGKKLLGERAKMSTNSVNLSVNLLGREYRIGCAEEEREDLLAAVDLLQARMREVREGSKSSTPERLAVLAALNLANELLKARAGGSETNFDSTKFRRRIVAMQDAIDSAMAGQEKLF